MTCSPGPSNRNRLRPARQCQARKPKLAQNSTVAAVPPATQPSAPAPSLLAAASSGVIQSQDTSTQGVVGELIQCRRSGGVLSVKIRFHNTTGAGMGFYALGPNTEL